MRERVDALRADDPDHQYLFTLDDLNQCLYTSGHVQRVPVASADLLLAALPNGYFSGDLDTSSNHAVARRLASEHGYRYAAMGACWLAFERSSPATAEQARAVVADLADLYAVDRGWDPLERAITGATHLLLGFTENFAGMLD